MDNYYLTFQIKGGNFSAVRALLNSKRFSIHSITVQTGNIRQQEINQACI